MKLKITVIIISVASLVACAAAALYALNASVPVYMEITVRCENYEQTVKPYRYNRTLYCVFLPSCAGRELICQLDGADSIVIDGVEYLDGQAIEVQIDESFYVEFRRGAFSDSIRYMFIPSSRVGDVFVDTQAGYVVVASASGLVSYDGRAAVEGFDSSAKTDMTVELANPSFLLSMSGASEWRLLSNSADRTHMRNKFAYDLFVECGTPGAPESEYVDLFVDGEYRGLYLLAQSVSAPQADAFVTDGGVGVSGGGGAAQDFELALQASDGVSPQTGRHFSEYIDVREWALVYLMAEVLSDTDMEYVTSGFYERGGKLYQSAAYSFASKMGNCRDVWSDPCRMLSDAGALLPDRVCWYTLLSRRPEFMQYVRQLYEDVVQPRIVSALCNGLDSYRTHIARAKVLDDIVWEGRNDYDGPDIDDWREQIYYLREFLTVRQEFLTALWIDGEEYCRIVITSEECRGSDSMIYYASAGSAAGADFFKDTYFDRAGYSVSALRYADGGAFDVSEPIDGNIFLEAGAG